MFARIDSVEENDWIRNKAQEILPKTEGDLDWALDIVKLSYHKMRGDELKTSEFVEMILDSPLKMNSLKRNKR